MTAHEPEFLSEDEASRLWQRAAQLQAEAARMAEAAAEAAGSVADERADAVDGYQLEHVRSAAREAGIAAEYVDAALSDLRVERALPARKGTLARGFLGNPPDAVTVRRTLRASAGNVLSAMEGVFPGEPYRLALTDRQGDPLDGGVLVFTIQGAGLGVTEGFAGEASWADLRQIFVSLRAVPGDRPSCEVTIRGPVAWAHGLNVAIGGVMTGLAGGLGFGLGSAGAALVGAVGATMGLGVVAALVAAGVAVGGAALGSGAGLKGFRALYRYAIGRGERALQGLLSAVAVEAEGGWGFAPVEGIEPPDALPPALPVDEASDPLHEAP